MKTQKITLYIHIASGSREPHVSTSDMRTMGWPLIGTKEIEVEIPEVPVEQAELEALQEQAKEVEAESRRKMADIRSRMDEVLGKLSQKERTDG